MLLQLHLFLINSLNPQILSENWKSMSDEERSQFYKEAEHLKSLHKIQHPDYKYAPKVSKQVMFSCTKLHMCLRLC